MAGLVEAVGGVAAAGRIYAQARQVDPMSGQRAMSRWVSTGTGPKCGPTLLGLLRAREQDPRSLEERAAFVELARLRAERGEDLWTGVVVPRRSLEALAREVAPLDEQLRAQAYMADRREERQEQRGGVDAQEDEDELDVGAAVLRVLEGGVA